MTEMSPMEPMPMIPLYLRDLYPDLDEYPVGPPAGMTDAEVGTVMCLAGYTPFGPGRQSPVFADFWQPTPDQLELLNAGGVIELRMYVPQLVIHSLSVHPPAETPS